VAPTGTAERAAFVTEQRARVIVGQRSGGRCELAVPNVCLGPQHSVHHRLKRSHGGSWAPSNLLAACGSGTTGCHGWVESHPAWAMEEGLWLQGHQDPREVSAHMRWADQRSWWFLDDEGMLRWDESEFEALVPRALPAGLTTYAPKPSR